MKKYNLAEWIGFILILLGVALMLIQDYWEDSPFSGLADKNMLFGSIGLLIWAFGYMKRQAEEKKEQEGES